ncbi:16474_t:CDS:2, partial [Racocetra fulgida]
DKESEEEIYTSSSQTLYIQCGYPKLSNNNINKQKEQDYPCKHDHEHEHSCGHSCGCSHKQVSQNNFSNICLINIHIEFLINKTTAHLQPMDAGIIYSFKELKEGDASDTDKEPPEISIIEELIGLKKFISFLSNKKVLTLM